MENTEKDPNKDEKQAVDSAAANPAEKEQSGKQPAVGTEEKNAEPNATAEEKKAEPKVSTAEDKIAELEKQIETLKAENADLKDQVLRRAADFDNYRKRMLKEKQDAFDYANTNLLQDLLDSLDNFDRTVAAAENSKDVKSIASGVKMINTNLVKLLESKYNLSSYGEAGQKFNPDEHEAIGSVKGNVAEPVLKEVYLKGYKLKDRVIRHAKVMVTVPEEKKAETEKKEEKK